MRLRFSEIRGPHNSARSDFEALVAELLAAELGAQAINGTGGDQGVDCYLGKFGGEITIFQAKYFLDTLKPKQRREIKHSLTRAQENHRLHRWILCIPKDPTPSERTWFDSLAPNVEWWGETKLRSLLDKHGALAKRFFPDEEVAKRIGALESEVRRLRRNVLVSSRLNSRELSRADFIPYLYEAEKLCRLVETDLRTLQDENVSAPVDFCELYVYLNSDPTLVVSQPLVDFCIGHSPWHLILPPGTIYEMTCFGVHFRQECKPDAVLKALRESREAERLVDCFEQDSSSQETFAAYRSYMNRLLSLGVSQFSNANRLLEALRSGVFETSPPACIRIAKEDIEQGLKLFDDRRRSKWSSNIADATNLAFARSLQSFSRQPVRILSSAPSMMKVANSMFPGANPVRTSRQYAVLIRELSSQQDAGAASTSADVLRHIGEFAFRLRDLLERRSGSISRASLCSDVEVVQAFKQFAPFYRKTLRPVDEMLEDSVRALPDLLLSSLDSQYRILKGDSKSVAAFKESWDKACKELAAIESILRDNYAADDIYKAIHPHRKHSESRRERR